MYDIPIALSTLYHHAILLLQDNTVSTWMHQSDLILTLAPEHGKLISLVCFTACSVILYDMMPAHKWFAPIVLLTADGLFRLAGSAKYDACMILFSFLGAQAFQRKKMFNAGLFMGCACVCKIQVAPLLLAMALLSGSFWRVSIGASVLLLPWMIRQYLVMGNPLFPVLGSAFSETFYPSLRRAQTFWDSGLSQGWHTFPLFVVGLSPFIFWSLPMARGRMAVIGLIGAGGIWAGLSLQSRYLLPCLPFLLIPLSAYIATIPRRTMVMLSVAMYLYVLPSYMVTLNQGEIEFSYREAMIECRGKRVLSWGEERRYPMWQHGNVFWSYMSQPLIWKLATESESVDRMVVKIRQMGCDYLLINPYSLRTQRKFFYLFPYSPAGDMRARTFIGSRVNLIWRGSVVDGAGAYDLYKII